MVGRTDIVFWERRDRRRCGFQHGVGSAELQSLWGLLARRSEARERLQNRGAAALLTRRVED